MKEHDFHALELRKSGMSYEQIAVHLGITANAVAGRIGRAREWLRLNATAPEPVVTVPPPKPRAPLPPLAMIHLAEFDPVIRRALARRRAQSEG